MKKKSIRFVCSIAWLLMAGYALEPIDAQVSGNVALTSDYVFRGVSQTLENLAIQGGFDYEHDNGFYLGVWGSNVDFGTAAQVEIDLYLGFSREHDSGFSWNFGVIHYGYPDESEISFEEVYFGMGYKVISAIYYFSNDFVGSDESAGYLDVSLDFELPRDFGLALHVGLSTFDDVIGEDYVDYKLALSKSTKLVDLELSFTDTDTDQFGDLGDGRVVLTLSKAL